MSWRHTKAAGEHPLKDPTAKSVLMTLAHHANEYTGHCWPDIERIMLFTGLSKRAVQTAINRLETARLVRVKRSGGRGNANEYVLDIPDAPPMKQRKGADPAQKGAAGARKDARAAPQQSGKNKEQTRSLTADWKPTSETVAWATSEWPDCDLALEVGRFITVNLSKEMDFTNVEQAFRAWILRGKQLERSRHADRPSTKPAHGLLRSIARGRNAERSASH